VRQKGPRIDVDGVASGRLHNKHTGLGDAVPQIGRQPDAVLEIILFQGLVQTHGDGVQKIKCVSLDR
jgi:hypothetical protein